MITVSIIAIFTTDDDDDDDKDDYTVYATVTVTSHYKLLCLPHNCSIPMAMKSPVDMNYQLIGIAGI